MDKKEVIAKLKKFKVLLSKEMSFDKLILYGSYAKESHSADSDIDVAVVVDKIEGDFFSTRPLLWRVRREVDDRIEPVLLDKSNDPSGFLAEVMKNGIPV